MFIRSTSFLLLLVLSQLTFGAHRIISTDGFVTELIFAMGIQDELVAIDVTSQVPEEYKGLPNIGYHRALSAEGLLSLSPSIVIGSEHIGPENVVQALNAAEIPLLQLPSAKRPKEIIENISKVANMLDQADQGKRLNRSLKEKLKVIAKQNLKDERIAFLLSMDPSKLRLAGRGSNGDALIDLLGANNVGDFENYQNVSAESLLAMKPSVILVAGKSADTAVSDLLASQTILQFSDAGKKGKILSIDGGSLVAGLSLSAIDEALRLTKTLSAQ